MEYQKSPMGIESNSMDIIQSQLKENTYTPEELAVVKRIIHTSGDVAYQDIISVTAEAVTAGVNAVKSGCSIVTDTKMALAGINKTVLARLNCDINNYIDHEDVYALARKNETTRSMAAVDYVAKKNIDIFIVGNAPTALFRIGELIQEGVIHPKLVIAVPVGFVGAAESKEFIRTIDVPSISTIGNKGGSNIAAAIMNAILYLVSR